MSGSGTLAAGGIGRAVSSGPGPRRAPAMRLFVPEPALRTMIVGACVAGIVLYPLYAGVSLWLGAGLVLTVLVVWHAISASRNVPWLPGLTAATACVQWILAAWLSYGLDAASPAGTFQRMPLPAQDYFAYAVPVTMALVAGMYLPLARRVRHQWNAPAAERMSRSLRVTCDVMIVVGLVARFLIPFVPSSLRFAVMLVVQLSYVGAFALVLSRSRGWIWRIVPVFLLEAYVNTVDAQFLAFMLWVMFLCSIMIFRFRPRPRTLVLVGGLGVVLLLALNVMKHAYRDVLRSTSVAALDRPAIAAREFADILSTPSALLVGQNVALNIGRFNQGWIIGRVMLWVPTSEPYAEGETISAAIRAALLPRILDPGKVMAGGRVNFPRFTGLTLISSTSMNLGIAGEMYANFGRQLAMLAVFVYGLLLGSLFAMFVRWSRQSPLWWAWAPFITFTTISAEMSTTEIFNHATKAFFVMLVVTTLVPSWALLRRWKMQQQIARIAARRRLKQLQLEPERSRA